LKALREAIWELPLPVIVLGGIYSGVFVVGEAAAITTVYVLLVEMAIHKDIGWRDLPGIIRKSMVLVGGILIILGAALGLTNYLIDEQIPMKLLELMKHHITSPVAFLIILNLFLLAAGCIMGMFSALTVVVPLVTPIALAYGIHPVHLGVIFLTNLEIGASIPPLGVNLFISSIRFERPVLKLYWASLPFIAVLLVALAIITYLPWLSLALLK
jgi:tripartite ATP-independent transporter DctM subunit